MPLAIGTKLGSYEILAPLGAGGMGEVYRARDNKLGRAVALKVLPATLAGDAAYMARFQREAQVLASLNHPHIASIYGLEESGGVRALVMELVEGPTLADRIHAGPVPIQEALELARQIAEALEYAHEKGVIHRDLKPANVKVTLEGTVKVLDFGLAKAAPTTSDSEHWENSPTQVSVTDAGMILGTAAYMSPEQARGDAVDKRSDIWAFGVVLLEMITGKRVFGGKKISETLAAVPARTPANIRTLLKRCLERERKRRLQAISEARIAIEDYQTNPASAAPSDWRRALPSITAAAILAIAAITFAVLYFHQTPEDSPLLRYSIPPPERTRYVHLALSPDGRLLAFVADAANDHSIWVQRLDSLAAQRLPGTGDAYLPFWSPDSRFVGFYDNRDLKLKKVDVTELSAPSLPQPLSDTPGYSSGATWGRDGVIIFGPGTGGGLYRGSAAGGEAKVLTVLDRSRQERVHRWPWLLPDGRHFLYTVVSDNSENAGIYVGAVDSPERKRLVGDLSNAVYVAAPAGGGFLLFVRGGNLLAQPFDAAKLRLAGTARSVPEPVAYNRGWSQGYFAVSENGLLAYLRPWQGQLTWFDRTGRRLGTVGEPGHYGIWVGLSPDGKQAAATRLDPSTETYTIWLIDLARGISSRFMSGSTDARYYWRRSPLWSPDGARIVFSTASDDSRQRLHVLEKGGVRHMDLYEKDARGGSKEVLLLKSDRDKFATNWSPDGRFVLYEQASDYQEASPGTAPTGSTLWSLPLSGDRKPVPLPGEPGILSPNGKWIAYLSDESGQSEIYVRSFVGAEASLKDRANGKWRISTGGGMNPHWRRDGREVFYRTGDGKMMAVEVSTGPTLEPGVPRPLFDLPASQYDDFDVTADGQRFLMFTRVEGSSSAIVVSNWMKELKP
jgi:serine/threonine protein kinase